MERRKAGPGSITQWIAKCQCDELIFPPDESAAKEQIVLCSACNKRVSAGRVGSLTQWVFRSDLCGCEKPNPVIQAVARRPEEPLSEAIPALDGEPGVSDVDDDLVVDSENFPTDRYSARSEIGRGVSGIVYLAADRMLQKNVAIKCLKSLNAEQLMSFQKEAQATSKLDHPEIVKIFDFGALPSGAPYMVMEYVDGVSLKEHIDEHGPFTEKEALPLFVDLACALAHAHARGIFHRDVKSTNVLVSRDRDGPGMMSVRLIDFGVASFKDLTDPQLKMGLTLVGTPPYMAPDQLLGKEFDGRSEIYSLGCLFYEMLIGHPPFLGVTALDTLNMHANKPLVPLSKARPGGEFSEELEAMIAECLAKKPEERFQNMGELLFRLETMLGNPINYKNSEDTTTGAAMKAPPERATFTILLAIVVGTFVLCFGLAAMLVQRLSLLAPKETPQVKMYESPEPVIRTLEDWNPEPANTEVEIFQPSPNRLSIRYGTDDSLDVLAQKGNVTELLLMNCTLTEKGVARLLPLTLDRLTLHATKLDSSGVNALCKLKSLKTLELRRCPDFTGLPLKNFQGMSLEKVTVDDTGVFDEAFEFLKNQKNLDSFSVARDANFTGTALNYLTAPKFRALELFELPSAPEALFEKIAAIKSLRYLGIKDSYFQEGRTNVETVVQPSPVKTPYDLNAFKHLASMRQLTGLALDCDRMIDEHYDLVSDMKLTGLTLSGNRYISPRNIEKLGNAASLHQLKVIGTCLERVGLQKICSMKQLVRLSLCDSDLTDNDLSVFEKSSVSLLYILGQNTISDRGLNEYISKMKSLKILKLPHISMITPAGVRQFRKLKPDCQVEYK